MVSSVNWDAEPIACVNKTGRLSRAGPMYAQMEARTQNVYLSPTLTQNSLSSWLMVLFIVT